jgi:hypothetical protein
MQRSGGLRQCLELVAADRDTTEHDTAGGIGTRAPQRYAERIREDDASVDDRTLLNIEDDDGDCSCSS